MNPSFGLFLKTDELDDLLKLRGQINGLGEEEEKGARDVLESWSDQQAVSNLLFYPTLIPAACRERFVLKGLCETERPYLILAAVVGVGSLAKSGLSPETRREIKGRLVSLCRDCDDVVGERASVTLRSFLESDDLSMLRDMFRTRNRIVRENMIGWIIHAFGVETEAQFTGVVKAARFSWFQRRNVLKSYREINSNRAGRAAAFKTSPLLSYIPNLRDVKR